MSKRSKARFYALGVNGIGVALMIVVFAHTGGLVGAEIGVAGGTAVLAQRVLEAVFGDQAIRRLAQTAKDDLDARVQTLLADELLRYHMILNGLGVESDQSARLRQAARAVESARAAGLPTSVEEEAALPPAERRLAIDAPTVSQIPSGEASDDSDIVDAELVDQPGRGAPIVAARGLGLLSRKDASVRLVDHLRALTEAVSCARAESISRLG